MRVGVIDPSLFTLAYDRHLCEGLARAGADVTLFGRTLRPDEALVSQGYRFEPAFYRRTERGARSRMSPTLAWLKALEHVLESRRLAGRLGRECDVLHFQWSPLPAWDQRTWRRLGRQRALIFTVHDTTPFLGRPTHPLQKVGWRALLDLAHGLIVHTESSRKVLVDLGVPAEKIEVVHHGPLHGPAPVPQAPRQFVDPAPGRRGTILVFGEIKPYKGIDVLLRAAARLPRDLAAGWRIVIAGRPRCDLGELQALASASRVSVEWRPGFVPDAEIGPLFAQADLVVFPYRRIDASGALMLALPFGAPIIASRIGIFAEMLADGVTGLLTPPGDDVALAGALERAMRDPELRRTLGENARAAARSVCSWDEIGQAHARIYRKHLPGGRGPCADRRGDAPAVRPTEEALHAP